MKVLRILAVVSTLLLAAAPAAAADAEEIQARAENCLEVLQGILDLPEEGISSALLENAHGVAIIPHVVKLAFVLGGRSGKGVVLVRQPDGSWSPPVFVSLKGGSVGWQIGAQATDVVLVFKTRRGVEGLLEGKFTLGGDASVAAGPVGRQAGAATDTQLKAEIYSYARSRGIFAGLSLEGSSLQVDGGANAAFYGAEEVSADRLVGGEAPPAPPVARQIQELLAAHTPTGEQAR